MNDELASIVFKKNGIVEITLEGEGERQKRIIRKRIDNPANFLLTLIGMIPIALLPEESRGLEDLR